MAVWTVYLSLCLLVALNASVETRSLANQRCGVETRPVGGKECGDCPEGWSTFGCRCFKFFSNPQTWAGAEKYCLYNDGNLASVHSHEEYMFIQRLVRQTTHDTTRAWIGGYDAVEERNWHWSDGTQINFQIWSPGEPNNHRYEHCLEINYVNGNWNDATCSVKKPFVCVK